MDGDWKRLGAYVVARRVELGYRSQQALDDVSGVSYRTISRLENGSKVGKGTVRALERALRWQIGSAERILAGGEPVEMAGAAEVPADADSRATRASILSATPEQLVEMRQVVEDVMGSAAADEFLRRAIALRTPPPGGGGERAPRRDGRAAG